MKICLPSSTSSASIFFLQKKKNSFFFLQILKSKTYSFPFNRKIIKADVQVRTIYTAFHFHWKFSINYYIWIKVAREQSKKKKKKRKEGKTNQTLQILSAFYNIRTFNWLQFINWLKIHCTSSFDWCVLCNYKVII